MIDRRTLLLSSSAFLPWSARAQAKVTKIVVGFPAGGAIDSVARVYAEELRTSAGANFIVDNRTGAGGRLGVQAVKDSARDGATLLLTPSSILTIYPHIYKKLPYDPIKDLAPVALACEYFFGLAVGPGTMAKTLPEFLDWARKNPKNASYGSPGSGTGPHFMGAMLGKASGAPLLHVPYRGGVSAIQDVIGGQLPALLTTLPNLLPQYRNGKIRILAVTSPQRLPGLADVPTFSELGFKDLSLREWFAFFAPAATPAPVIAQLHAAITKASNSPALREALAKQGFDAASGEGGSLGQMLRTELKSWEPIVKATGFTAED